MQKMPTISRSMKIVSRSWPYNLARSSAASFRIPKDPPLAEIGSISGFVRPIQKKWITVDFIAGAVFGGAKSLYLEGIDYEYSIDENRLTYLFTDYQLEKKNHFGYQVGIDVSFYLLKRLGLQIDARVQDLSNGGTFFFVGAGLCFRL